MAVKKFKIIKSLLIYLIITTQTTSGTNVTCLLPLNYISSQVLITQTGMLGMRKIVVKIFNDGQNVSF